MFLWQLADDFILFEFPEKFDENVKIKSKTFLRSDSSI